ncbi:DUF7344 domain-containing protein [Natrinema halophilum]|uniref:DUF7344 domain-containing protein n=1 Tax=Natrinema halophilum TaxID=1699371 RepID=A0A7D5GPH7_9EURY|nr:hypothetical protein [Natrinema halophilum]QLG50433.1 hypothetical protein HYG82_17050 [Natrinema halophilum]
MHENEWVQSLLAEPTGETLDMDEETLNRTLKVLRAPRRRAVCTVLERRRESVSVSDLATAVLELETDGETDNSEKPAEEYASVTCSLVHSHLPALADANLVSYDVDEKRVSFATDDPQWEANWLLEGLLSDAEDSLQTAEADDDRLETPRISDEMASETPAVEGSATVEPVADDDRMLWTLARPPAGRSHSGGRSSSREISTRSEPSSAVGEPHDGTPPT